MKILKFSFWISVIIFSVIWAQEIKPTPRNVPLCEIKIVNVVRESTLLIATLSSVSIYSDSNISAPISNQLKIGDTFPIQDKKGDWYKINLPNGKTGWIMQTLENRTVIKTTASAVIYAEPNYTATPIYQSKINETFDIQDKKDDWYKILLPNGKTGWISRMFAKESKSYNITAFTKGMSIKDTVKSVIHESDKLVGRILYVTDSFLVFWQTKEQYDSSKINYYAIKIPYYDIEQISIHRYISSSIAFGSAGGCLAGIGIGYIVASGMNEDYFGPVIMSVSALGLGSGTLIGGVVGLVKNVQNNRSVNNDLTKYKASILLLKKNSIFPFAPPPELHSFLEE
jgi:SH3-like domain-containing protein